MAHQGRRRFLASLGAAGSCLTLAALLGRPRHEPGRAASELSGLQPLRRSGLALGTQVSMVALHADRAVADRGLDAAFAALERVEQLMSIYRPHSQLSRLNRAGSLRDPHPLLLEVLLAAREVSLASAGAFDVTVQPLWQAYTGEGAPANARVGAARGRVGWTGLRLTRRRVWFTRPGMSATLNGIAQGFATDQALRALRRAGVAHALVDTGELGGLGQAECGGDWVVGVQHPRVAEAYIARARLDGRCIATSGDYATRHHLFDPRSGQLARAFQSVTVLARSGLQADALSTAVFVAGPRRGAALIERTPGADALFVLPDGRTRITRGFPRIGGGA